MGDKDGLIVFAEEPSRQPTGLKNEKFWKILIVDDEKDVHQTTQRVLGNFKFEGRGLHFLNAYSGTEAKRFINDYDDIAIVLLDVVMETNEAGLEIARYIREEAKNHAVRIILRTGQPGKAPEKKVIVDYDINDYKEKTELTVQKLFTAITSALRSYRDLKIIEKNKAGLEKIINASAKMFEIQSLKQFSHGVLTQLIAILRINDCSLYARPAEGFSAVEDGGHYIIQAATGSFETYVNQPVEAVIPKDIQGLLTRAIDEASSLFIENAYIGYFSTSNGIKHLLYLSGCGNLSDLDRDLVRIFSINVAIAFENINMHQRLEKLVEVRTDKLRKANTALQQANDAAYANVQAQSEFLTGMGHEIRSPMNGVLGAAELVLATQPSPKVERYIKIIQTSGHSLLDIINIILDFSKIMAAKLNLEITPFRLNEILEQLVDKLSPLSEKKGIELEIDMNPEIPLSLLGDPFRIQQILFNLLNYAITFAKKRKIITLGIRLSDLTGLLENQVTLEFFVKDTEGEMTPEYLKRLSEPFGRTGISPKTKWSKTELGLIVCKQLADLMNGEIRVESQHGQGTTFVFTLCLERQSQDQKKRISPSPPPIPLNISTLKKKLQGRRVLIAEDNPLHRIIFQAMFEEADMAVDIAQNGKEVITLINKNSYDAILMDIQMPEMDGLEATRIIRKTPEFKSLPIIAISAVDIKGYKKKCLQCGMNGYIVKPLSQEKLLTTLCEFIERKSDPTRQIPPCRLQPSIRINLNFRSKI